MKDKYRRMSEMGALPLTLVFLAAIILTFGNCKNKGNQSDASAADTLSNGELSFISGKVRNRIAAWLPNVTM